MTVEAVGRQAELACAHAFLERASEGALALVLEGDAGILGSRRGLGSSKDLPLTALGICLAFERR